MLSLILSAALANATEIKFFASSAPSKIALESMLTQTPTTFEATRNLKVSLVFDKAEAIARVHLESCEKDWSDGIQVFASPGLQRAFVEGGKKSFDAQLQPPIQSVAIVFGREAALCLHNLKVFAKDGKEIALQSPPTIEAKVSTPVLFDQHPDSLVALEEPATITFAEPQKFDRAIIWTGGSPLYAHSLKLTNEKGWKETLPLRNSSSDQEVIFKKPFEGKQITIAAPDAGEVGEIRFALGTKVGVVRAIASQIKTFEDAGFARTLDFNWVTGESESEKWLFNFRQDGTFIVRGYNDDQKQARDYSALGTFSVTRAEKNKIRMKINGVRFPSAFAWDGVSCPFACGNEGSLEGGSTLTDSLMLERVDDGSMIVRNRTPRAQRTVTIGDLKVRRAVDE